LKRGRRNGLYYGITCTRRIHSTPGGKEEIRGSHLENRPPSEGGRHSRRRTMLGEEEQILGAERKKEGALLRKKFIVVEKEGRSFSLAHRGLVHAKP